MLQESQRGRCLRAWARTAFQQPTNRTRTLPKGILFSGMRECPFVASIALMRLNPSARPCHGAPRGCLSGPSAVSVPPGSSCACRGQLLAGRAAAREDGAGGAGWGARLHRCRVSVAADPRCGLAQTRGSSARVARPLSLPTSLLRRSTAPPSPLPSWSTIRVLSENIDSRVLRLVWSVSHQLPFSYTWTSARLVGRSLAWKQRQQGRRRLDGQVGGMQLCGCLPHSLRGESAGLPGQFSRDVDARGGNCV